eukprot:8500453-Pyramimonas_sp.AAC.1
MQSQIRAPQFSVEPPKTPLQYFWATIPDGDRSHAQPGSTQRQFPKIDLQAQLEPERSRSARGSNK